MYLGRALDHLAPLGNDMVSRVYRNKRMGLNEGLFGAVRNRTGFNRGKS